MFTWALFILSTIGIVYQHIRLLYIFISYGFPHRGYLLLPFIIAGDVFVCAFPFMLGSLPDGPERFLVCCVYAIIGGFIGAFLTSLPKNLSKRKKGQFWAQKKWDVIGKDNSFIP